jgi:hypothetical protein
VDGPVFLSVGRRNQAADSTIRGKKNQTLGSLNQEDPSQKERLATLRSLLTTEVSANGELKPKLSRRFFVLTYFSLYDEFRDKVNEFYDLLENAEK